jgi:tripeptidyl-peptidase-1
MAVRTLTISLSAISALLGATNALPTVSSSNYQVKETHPVPRAWKATGPANKRETINLQIGLKQRNEGVVERHLMEVSDPDHKRYGQHLTAAEVADIVRPEEASIKQVHQWLVEHGIEDIDYSPAKDWISIVIPIEKAEELLQTSYTKFEHLDGHSISRAPEFSLPIHLHEHVDVVQPTTSFFKPRADVETSVSGPVLDEQTEETISWWEHTGKYKYGEHHGKGDIKDPSFCNVSFTTLDCLRTLYGTIDYKVQAADKNSIGINNYLNETSRRDDAYQFLKEFRPEAAQAAYDFKFEIIDNGANYQGPNLTKVRADGVDVEGNLDAQLVLGVSYPTPMKAYNTGGMPPFKPSLSTPTDTNEPYLAFLNHVLAEDNLPFVISSSYGDDEQSVPYAYAKRACAAFAQLGARGITYLVSSGDAGVGKDGTCKTNDGLNHTQFTPDFPTSCPWVTSVGGTANFNPETAVSRFASGAGFSNYFPAPDYQTKTVNKYVKSLKGQFDGLYNKTGRAYPDVAAQGNHDIIVWAGKVQTVGGTSASSPTFAAVIALVNDALIAKGKKPLGFLNPWLYSKAYKTFTDVTIGSSFGCNTTGFPAQKGWDAVTGWGTPVSISCLTMSNVCGTQLTCFKELRQAGRRCFQEGLNTEHEEMNCFALARASNDIRLTLTLLALSSNIFLFPGSSKHGVIDHWYHRGSSALSLLDPSYSIIRNQIFQPGLTILRQPSAFVLLTSARNLPPFL